MQRAVWRVAADAAEAELDAVLPQLVDGVHEHPVSDGVVELVAYAVSAPLPTIPGARLEEVPDDAAARRRLHDRGVTVGGRVRLRGPDDPPAGDGLLDLVIERSGAFGDGAHPTTRMCLELLLGVEPRGAFADLGCGAGALAIAACHLGFAPVTAIDVAEHAVAATLANAEVHGVTVHAQARDLSSGALPEARVAAANVPLEVHATLAARLRADTVLASGVRDLAAVVPRYPGFQLTEAFERDGWAAARLDRT